MAGQHSLQEAAKLLDDTIVALATGGGHSAIGVVRLSGSPSRIDAILEKSVRFHSPALLRPGRLRRVQLIDPSAGEPIDDGLLVRFAGPNSYTGEDVVELSLHGSPVVLEAALEVLQRAGARAARPGEFTRRAVMNGKMGLVEAEAVGALIDADSELAARLARRHLGGEFDERIQAWKQALLTTAAALEALVDFPEEVEAEEIEAQLSGLGSCRTEVERLAASYRAGRRLVRGPRLAITGPVNAGKSTLFNMLLDFQRAIVSQQEGTTRDVVSETVDWDGASLRIEDTAGLRETSNQVEQEGIERSARAVEHADLVVEVRDGRTRELPEAAERLVEGPNRRLLWVATHADLLGEDRRAHLEAEGWILTSAPEGMGLSALRKEILSALRSDSSLGGLMVHTARQHTALRAAAEAMAEACEHGDQEPTLAALAVRAAVDALDELVGRWDNEEVLDEVFARFCIGK